MLHLLILGILWSFHYRGYFNVMPRFMPTFLSHFTLFILFSLPKTQQSLIFFPKKGF